jgi:LPXTG-site transpeptidase (sortase) family protein
MPDAKRGLDPSLPQVLATGLAPQASGQAYVEVSSEPALADKEAPTLQETALPPLAEAVEATVLPVEDSGTIPPPAEGAEATLPETSPDPEGRPVQIRIPSIKVKRGIVALPLIQDPGTGSWTRDLKALFRKGRKDLVGHYEESAQPGQPGNTILAGHNYGYGTKGVFLRLGRLKQGMKIEVVNASGQAFIYRVESVYKIPWKSKDAEELIQHARLLAPSGSERLTLVTCGGGKVYPFPARIYAIAEPVRD